MLQIMLCGAHEVGQLDDAFTEVVQDFGGEPYWFQRGRIHHINSRTSSWSENSRATVKNVDICVFVILERYGDLTWNHELREALELGKPFVVLALQSAWDRFTNLRHSLTDMTSIKSEDDRLMVDLLRMISSDYELSVTPFTYATFKENLRNELSVLFQEGARLLRTRNQRAALLEMIAGVGGLSRHQIDSLIELATDEYEPNKLERKTALRRLAAEEIRDSELLFGACRSSEQGVQRLGFELLPRLIPIPPDEDHLRELAHIAARADDVGVPRRLVSAISDIEPGQLDVVLDAIGTADEGVRRLAFEGVEKHWKRVFEAWGADRMSNFLDLCEAKVPTRRRWIDRLRSLKEDLT